MLGMVLLVPATIIWSGEMFEASLLQLIGRLCVYIVGFIFILLMFI